MTKPAISIVTTCKERLSHLRQTLPAMLAQPKSEVIVVDYSCPEQTGDVVEREFPGARVVRVANETEFSNWKARNAGAAAAIGRLLMFCDADNLLAPNAVEAALAAVPAGRFGGFGRASSRRSNRAGERLGNNQLRGFQVVPAAAFRAAGGYDELFEGYSEADIELGARLRLAGLKPVELDPAIVERVLDHDDDARLRHHRSSIGQSYGTGLIYRKLKIALLRLRGRRDFPLAVRRQLYEAAREAASRIDPANGRVRVEVNVTDDPVGMPRQLGFEEARIALSLALVIEGLGAAK